MHRTKPVPFWHFVAETRTVPPFLVWSALYPLTRVYFFLIYLQHIWQSHKSWCMPVHKGLSKSALSELCSDVHGSPIVLFWLSPSLSQPGQSPVCVWLVKLHCRHLIAGFTTVLGDISYEPRYPCAGDWVKTTKPPSSAKEVDGLLITGFLYWFLKCNPKCIIQS